MSFLQVAVLVVGIIGFGMSFVVQFQLKNHISIEKVRSVSDPKELYPNSIPPKTVLNEKGLQLYKVFQSGFFLFFGAIVILMITGVFDSM